MVIRTTKIAITIHCSSFILSRFASDHSKKRELDMVPLSRPCTLSCLQKFPLAFPERMRSTDGDITDSDRVSFS